MSRHDPATEPSCNDNDLPLPSDGPRLALVYHPAYDVPMPEGHPFPMSKFRGVYDLLRRGGLATPADFHRPEPLTPSHVELVHDPSYVAAYLDGTIDPRAMRRIGFTWSEAIVRRTMHAGGGTLLTTRLALEHGLAANIAGGTHHAFPDFGSGFCIFNDMAIAIRVLQRERLVRRVLVVDLDVHQGDGTAVVFRSDPDVFTFSMHGARNFPRVKRESDLDIALPDATGDRPYLEALRAHLPRILADFGPDLVVYDAGVDPHAADRFGKLALSDAGLERRDRYVLRTCREAGHPVACVIGGGYDRDLATLVRRHTIVHRAAAEVLAQSARQATSTTSTVSASEATLGEARRQDPAAVSGPKPTPRE